MRHDDLRATVLRSERELMRALDSLRDAERALGRDDTPCPNCDHVNSIISTLTKVTPYRAESTMAERREVLDIVAGTDRCEDDDR